MNTGPSEQVNLQQRVVVRYLSSMRLREMDSAGVSLMAASTPFAHPSTWLRAACLASSGLLGPAACTHHSQTLSPDKSPESATSTSVSAVAQCSSFSHFLLLCWSQHRSLIRKERGGGGGTQSQHCELGQELSRTAGPHGADATNETAQLALSVDKVCAKDLENMLCLTDMPYALMRCRVSAGDH